MTHTTIEVGVLHRSSEYACDSLHQNYPDVWQYIAERDIPVFLYSPHLISDKKPRTHGAGQSTCFVADPRIASLLMGPALKFKKKIVLITDIKYSIPNTEKIIVIQRKA